MDPELEPIVDTTIDAVADPVVDESAAAPIEPVVEKVAEKVPATMEDTIRDKLRELNAPPDENNGKPGFVKDPVTGRFVEKPREVAKPAAAVNRTDGVAPPVVADPAKAVVDKPIDLTQPPAGWGAQARAEYAKLSPAVQQQVHKREADFHKGLSEYKQSADVGREIMADFAPYLPHMRANNVTPKQLVQAWTNLEYKLHSATTPEGKAKVMLEAAKAYGVDAAHMAAAAGIVTPPAVGADGQPVVTAPIVDPRFKALEDRLAQVTTHLETEKNAQARIEYTKIEDEVRMFAQTPGHEHFEAVRHDMSALMQTGRASSMDDAYNKAIWANPEVRAILLEQQRVDEANRAVEKAAAAKKAASANVAPRGTPPVRKPVAGSGTMDDTLRQAFRAIQARDAA